MLSRDTLGSLCLLMTIANLVYIGWHVTLKVDHPHSPQQPIHSHTYRGHDFPETVPLPFGELPLVSMKAEESERFSHLGPDYDDDWFSLSTKSYGYVRLGPADRLFMVTMFHELHCLRVLNLAFGKHNIASLPHLQHCLNYLRFGVLCSADLTLEPGNFEDKDFEVDREGATHTCRDWTKVYPVMDENFFSWKNRTAEDPGLPMVHTYMSVVRLL